jgi:hypothetical protein
LHGCWGLARRGWLWRRGSKIEDNIMISLTDPFMGIAH